MIDKRPAVLQKSASVKPQQSNDPSVITWWDLFTFLAAFTILGKEEGFVRELEYAMQQQELEQYKYWAIEKKIRRHPDVN